MHRALAALSLLLAACPAAAIEKRKTVYLDRMTGFERHVRAAIQETMLNVGILDESIQPDFRMFLDPRFRSPHAQFLHRKVTGRAENAVLELYDTRSKQALVRYSFQLTDDEVDQREAARGFIEHIRKRLNLSGSAGVRQPSAPAGVKLEGRR